MVITRQASALAVTEIARRLERAQTMCMDGAMEIDELKARSAPLKARRLELQLELQSLLAEAEEPSVLSLHPGVAEAYRRMAEQLRAALDDVAGLAPTLVRDRAGADALSWQLKFLRVFERKNAARFGAAF
jgi:hypothetical protein